MKKLFEILKILMKYSPNASSGIIIGEDEAPALAFRGIVAPAEMDMDDVKALVKNYCYYDDDYEIWYIASNIDKAETLGDNSVENN